ncbi:GHKL domain-containing protein [Poseidonibacter ostreae]|uniref:sensor histidine kinase n=1 Tax=Poseidonibacter ostreae TaxID=2654171 RepID=UPI001265AA99|nr:HAMP domain-containing sensor histidine kinase [Poseidonibacter ostreae]KAB7887481.1 GHKL domain-containing protein [Poseidonibacter ostreae]
MTNNQLHNALFELLLNIGTSFDFKESANNALLSYIQQLDCAGIILYEKNDKEYNPIVYKPKVLQRDIFHKKVFEIFIKKLDTESDLFKDNLPFIINKNKTNYYIYKLENFGFLLFIKNAIAFENHIIKALRTVNDKFAKSLESCRNLEQIRQKDKMIFRQSKMAAMGEVIENITHQWRQPLSLISSTASGINILMDYGKFDEKELKPLLNDIVDKTSDLSQTIEDFKSYFNNDVSKSNFFINSLFIKTSNFLYSRLKKANIEFILNNTNDIEIYSYKNQLMQIIMNILNNAIDELEKLDLERKLIIIDITNEEGFAVVSIKDNAFGIPSSLLNKVFNPYFTRKEKGTGLGLSMSKEILEKYIKGTIIVSNLDFVFDEKEYKGANFTLKIPIN